MRPYLFMSVFYVSIAVLMAADSALISLGLIPAHPGIVWLRIHLITIGTMTQVLFGILPSVVATRAGQERPRTRWDIWLALNGGLALLLVGIPLINATLIISGGTLVFVAAGLLIDQLQQLRGQTVPLAAHAVYPKAGRKFYIAGLLYLLLGIVIGTGLWFGWTHLMRIAVPIEVHIHANNWGFMALVFAGLLVDLYPQMTGYNLAATETVNRLFWMMSLGALGLVIGPWVKGDVALWFSVPGLILHLSATVWLLVRAIQPLRNHPTIRKPGIWHIVTSYFWFLAPVLIAPLIILKVPGFPGAGIEANAPQALVYGWVLQFGYAIIPFLLRRVFFPERPAELGGNWLSLITVHIGGFFLWASIFVRDYQGPLRGVAYTLWLISMIPMVIDIWHLLRAGITRLTALQEMEDAAFAPVKAPLLSPNHQSQT